MYEHGDQKGAATLRAAAEAIQDANASEQQVRQDRQARRSSPVLVRQGAGGGADMVGQMVSQVGQQARPDGAVHRATAARYGPRAATDSATSHAGRAATRSTGVAGGRIVRATRRLATPSLADDRAGPASCRGRFPDVEVDHAAAGDTRRCRQGARPTARRAEPAQTVRNPTESGLQPAAEIAFAAMLLMLEAISPGDRAMLSSDADGPAINAVIGFGTVQRFTLTPALWGSCAWVGLFVPLGDRRR